MKRHTLSLVAGIAPGYFIKRGSCKDDLLCKLHFQTKRGRFNWVPKVIRIFVNFYLTAFCDCATL